MLIAYFISLVIYIIFKLMHWPGTLIFFMLIFLLPLIEFIIQVARKTKDKLKIWSAVAAIGLSIYILYSMHNWPAHQIQFFVGLAAIVPYYIFFIKRRSKPDVRFVIISLLSVLMFVNVSLKDSSRIQLYMLEDPFREYVPIWTLQHLAFAYYGENEPAKAEKLLTIGVHHLERVVSKPDKHGIHGFSIEIFQHNLELMKSDLLAVQQRKWSGISELYPEDVEE